MDAFNSTIEASNDFADELSQISEDIKEANNEVQRKGDMAFQTYEGTLDSIEEIQARAAEEAEREIEDFFNGIANA